MNANRKRAAMDRQIRRGPDNYKPRRVPEAFKVHAVGTTNARKGESNVEKAASPIENIVNSAFVHVSDLRRSAEWYSMVNRTMSWKSWYVRMTRQAPY